MPPGTALDEKLRAEIGKQGQPQLARDPVNQALIRQWCDAMEDQNPAYADTTFASNSVHGQIVSPPAMLSVWSRPGNALRPVGPDDPVRTVLVELAAAGYTSVVATSLAHEYVRYLRLGDVLAATQWVHDVSAEKRTALGAGRFVTTATEYRAQTGDLVGRARLDLLAFKAGRGHSAASAGESASKEARPPRPRPGISRDTQFFWDGVRAGELRIQRCARCGELHHPPMVRCPQCGSHELGYQVSSGKGVVYSFVEPCHPRVAAFDYPYVVGLVELEEGTRLITNLVHIDPDAVAIGMPVELVFGQPDPELTLPLFRPRRPARRETTLAFDEVNAGDELPPCPIPITARLIVAGALASRDYDGVHHDRDAANRSGLPDILMNIFTTGGLCARYVSDWAGPEALLRGLTIRLGTPNHPHDTMTIAGAVCSKGSEGETNLIDIRLRGYNRRGDHASGSIVVELPTTARIR